MTMGDATGGMIAATIGQLLSALQAKSGVFVGLGTTFMSLAVILTIFGGIYSWWVSGSIQDLVENGVRTIILAGPLLLLLNGWSDYMTTFEKFFHTELPSTLGITGGTPAAVVGESIQEIMKAVDLSGALSSGGKNKSWWDTVTDAFSMKMIYSLIVYCLVFVLNCLLIFGLIFAVFMPVAGIYIGAIFGPVILGWLPWKPLADMTAKWSGFMISNGIAFVVAITIVHALKDTIKSMVDQIRGMAGDSVMSGLTGYAMTLVALFAIYLFATNLLMQANNIAQGMTGGAAVGEGLIGKMASMVGAAGMMRAGGATANLNKMGAQGAAKAAGSIAGKGADKAASGLSSGAKGAGKVLGDYAAARAIGGKSGGSALASAANAAKAVGQGIDKAQAGVKAGAQAAKNVAAKGASAAKESGVYKELDKDIKQPLR